jgi:hypothetical protein
VYKETHIIEGKTLAEWSVVLGVKHSTLRQRLNRTGSIHKLVDGRKLRDPSTYKSKGREPKLHNGKTLKQWAEDQGVSVSQIMNRIRHHGDPTYKKPRVEPRKNVRVPFKFENKTAKEWSLELGVSRMTVYKNITKYGVPWTPEDKPKGRPKGS